MYKEETGRRRNGYRSTLTDRTLHASLPASARFERTLGKQLQNLRPASTRRRDEVKCDAAKRSGGGCADFNASVSFRVLRTYGLPLHLGLASIAKPCSTDQVQFDSFTEDAAHVDHMGPGGSMSIKMPSSQQYQA